MIEVALGKFLLLRRRDLNSAPTLKVYHKLCKTQAFSTVYGKRFKETGLVSFGRSERKTVQLCTRAGISSDKLVQLLVQLK